MKVERLICTSGFGYQNFESDPPIAGPARRIFWEAFRSSEIPTFEAFWVEFWLDKIPAVKAFREVSCVFVQIGHAVTQHEQSESPQPCSF